MLSESLNKTFPSLLSFHKETRCFFNVVDIWCILQVADFGLTKMLQPLRQQCTKEDCCCKLLKYFSPTLSLPPSLSLSLPLFPSLSLSLPLALPLSLSYISILYLCLSVYISQSVCLFKKNSHSLSPFISVSICLSVCVCLSIYIILYIYLPTFPTTYVPILLST